jgi:hypothetical protein
MTTTDTPRTDAASFSSRDPLELMQTSQQLERELLTARNDAFNLANALSKAEAEIERLKSMIERAMGPCSWPEYETTKELPND